MLRNLFDFIYFSRKNTTVILKWCGLVLPSCRSVIHSPVIFYQSETNGKSLHSFSVYMGDFKMFNRINETHAVP